MTTSAARNYLLAASRTEVGRSILTDLGYSAIIACPTQGDDYSTITIAAQVLDEFNRRYLIG